MPETTSSNNGTTTTVTIDGQQGASVTQAAPLEFDSWITEQPEPVKALLDDHVKKLRTALVSEREGRESLEKQLREVAAGKAGEVSEMRAKLTQIADQLKAESARANFNEAAHAAGIGNLKAAYTLAMADGLFDGKGQPDFAALKASYPELFAGAKKLPAGDAGAGTSTKQPTGETMNDLIRRAAGYK
jgi:hypothetical protein